jgi:hypothetical protein
VSPYTHQHNWLSEMAFTWALAGAGWLMAAGVVLKAIIAVAAVSASCLSAYVGWRRFLWELADRKSKSAPERSTIVP